MTDDRAILCDQNGRDFDCVFEGDPLSRSDNSFRCVVRPVSAFITHDMKFEHQVISEFIEIISRLQALGSRF
jgi:hypothetical protein